MRLVSGSLASRSGICNEAMPARVLQCSRVPSQDTASRARRAFHKSSIITSMFSMFQAMPLRKAAA